MITNQTVLDVTFHKVFFIETNTDSYVNVESSLTLIIVNIHLLQFVIC